MVAKIQRFYEKQCVKGKKVFRKGVFCKKRVGSKQIYGVNRWKNTVSHSLLLVHSKAGA